MTEPAKGAVRRTAAGASVPDRLERDLDLLDEALRPRVISLRRRLSGRDGGAIGEKIQLAIAAAFAGDQAAAAACIAEAEALRPARRTIANPPGATSGKARTIISSGITGKVRAAGISGPVLVATDGSFDRRAYSGWGFLATSGQWGCQAGTRAGRRARRDEVLVAELRAVYLALTRVPGPVTILADSRAALNLLRAWQRGDTARMPAGYAMCQPGPGPGAKPVALARLAKLTARRGGELTFEHVKGHTGHVLNEAADTLAGIACGWMAAGGRPGREAMTTRAADIAVSFLTAWRQQAA